MTRPSRRQPLRNLWRTPALPAAVPVAVRLADRSPAAPPPGLAIAMPLVVAAGGRRPGRRRATRPGCCCSAGWRCVRLAEAVLIFYPAVGPVRPPRWAWRRRSATTSTPTCSGCRSAFHDGWQSGQLLSRVTADLVGDPAVPVVRAGLPGRQRRHVRRPWSRCWCTCTGRSGCWWRRARSRCSWSAGGSPARYNAASRRMQDQQGDLATLVEETAGGMRVIKAFGRRAAHGARRFDARRASGCTTRPSARPGCWPRTSAAVRPGAQPDARRSCSSAGAVAVADRRT